jgi:predicted KAP-like P-loop ATPase
LATNTGAQLGYLSDQETKVDLLNNEAIARTVVRLILETVDSPITIGVHGDWGAGKSSVLEMVAASFPDDDDVLCLKFSGWQFQGFEDAKIALIEGVVNGLIAKRSLATKASDEVKRVLKSVDWLKVAKKGGGLGVTALTGIPVLGLEEIFGFAVDLIKNTVTDKDAREAAIKQLGDLKKEKTDASTSHSVPTEIHEFRESYKALIEKAGIKRLVVLIDDLDRCLPQTAIETLEAIRLFVLWEKTAFVVGADEGMKSRYAITSRICPSRTRCKIIRGHIWKSCSRCPSVYRPWARPRPRSTSRFCCSEAFLEKTRPSSRNC